MRTLALLFLVSSTLAAPALASAQTQIIESRFDKAPWWMDQPVIASTGYVEKEFQANRANFTASFLVVERTVEEATKVAAAYAAAITAIGVRGRHHERPAAARRPSPLAPAAALSDAAERNLRGLCLGG